MFVVVIGLGQVGRHLIRTLEWEKHDVVAIDSNPAAIAEVEEHHDVMTMEGYGASISVLKRAGVEKADLVAAITDNDEVNLVAALAARQMGARRVIARVQGPEWASSSEGVQYGVLGVDVIINPHVLIAQEIAKIARSHGATEVIGLADDRIELVQVELPESSRLLNKKLAKLPLPPGVIVAAVVRRGELRVPGGSDVLLPHDRVYLVGKRTEVERAEDLFTTTREARRICIVGGGVIGTSLASTLVAGGCNVLVIERDRLIARELAERFRKVTVIHGDGTDLALLEEERVADFDLFVVVSHEDEVNLMAALLAKRAGAKRTLSLVHRPDYMEIYRQLGVDIVLSPRIVASDHILRFCRGTELKSLTMLEHGRAEVLEIVVQAGCKAIGTPLHRLGVPRGAIVAAILHGDEVTIGHGDAVIEEGDTVVVLTVNQARTAVARLFRARDR